MSKRARSRGVTRRGAAKGDTAAQAQLAELQQQQPTPAKRRWTIKD